MNKYFILKDLVEFQRVYNKAKKLDIKLDKVHILFILLSSTFLYLHPKLPECSKWFDSKPLNSGMVGLPSNFSILCSPSDRSISTNDK